MLLFEGSMVTDIFILSLLSCIFLEISNDQTKQLLKNTYSLFLGLLTKQNCTSVCSYTNLQAKVWSGKKGVAEIAMYYQLEIFLDKQL